MRTSDGQVGKASAADGTLENATVIGFANSTVSANSSVKVVVVGLKTLSSLNPGDLFFLSIQQLELLQQLHLQVQESYHPCRRSIYCY